MSPRRPVADRFGALARWGWDERWQGAWIAAGADVPWEPARAVRTDRGEATVETAAGSLRVSMASRAIDVVAGDWLAIDRGKARVDRVLPRRTAFVRRAARGALRAQALASNADIVAVCHGLDRTMNLRRLERELVVAFDSGATPIVVLTKGDLVEANEVDGARADARQAAAGCAVVATSCTQPDGLAELRAAVPAGSTVALLGTSGVGKSSLANAWSGESVQGVASVRKGDGKGRHTTTAAELLLLPDGRLLLDTPGIRALALWTSESGLERAFPEIATLAEGCRFADCSHHAEPDCAVREAVVGGAVDPDRVDHFARLRDELAELADALNERDRRPISR